VSLKIEINSTNSISTVERHGKASDLFWPWCGANVSVLAISYGAYFLGFGINFKQATLAALIGTILSFLLVGVSSLAGKKSNLPTMVLSRAIFGVKGNLLPGFLSYLVFVGWETVLVAVATLATGTILGRIGHLPHDLSLLIGFFLSVTLTVLGGVFGFTAVMRLQRWISVITGIATVTFILLTFHQINWSALASIKPGPVSAVVGAIIFGMTGIGLGWVNSAADYSRYLPRETKSRSVVGWTVVGASTAPIVMVIYGAALAGSSKELSEAVASDPVGALTEILPTWFLAIFAIVAILGLIGGAILDLYSSGLALVAIGVPIKRHVAASIDALMMFLGTIYIVWFSSDFLIPFQGFLITVGVPLAAWSAIFVADVLLTKEYDEEALYRSEGKYGSVNKSSLTLMVIATIIGFGFVTNTFASWLGWQGYFMGLIGGKDGAWAGANTGVLFALMIGFVGRVVTLNLNKKN
jgi:purine-cytosine permease-like protein